MIYAHLPQRGGRSIKANTNNPPQDPPLPNEIDVETPIAKPKPVIVEKIPWWKRFISKLLFWRKNNG